MHTWTLNGSTNASFHPPTYWKRARIHRVVSIASGCRIERQATVKRIDSRTRAPSTANAGGTDRCFGSISALKSARPRHLYCLPMPIIHLCFGESQRYPHLPLSTAAGPRRGRAPFKAPTHPSGNQLQPNNLSPLS